MPNRIGKNAALRSQIVRGDKCKTCKFIGEICKGVAVTVEKDYGYPDDRYFMIVRDCARYERETLTIDGVKALVEEKAAGETQDA